MGKARGFVATFLKHLFTDNDNETYDTTRTIFVLSWLYVCVVQAVSVFVLKHDFNVQDFGVGMGAITAAFGLSKAGESKLSEKD